MIDLWCVNCFCSSHREDIVSEYQIAEPFYRQTMESMVYSHSWARWLVNNSGRQVWWGGQWWYPVCWNVRGRIAGVWMNRQAVDNLHFPLLWLPSAETSAVCYWCSDETRDPEDWCFIDDWPKALCGRCCHWYAHSNGGPYEPRALTRQSERIGKFFPRLPEAVAKRLASFLHAWHEP